MVLPILKKTERMMKLLKHILVNNNNRLNLIRRAYGALSFSKGMKEMDIIVAALPFY